MRVMKIPMLVRTVGLVLVVLCLGGITKAKEPARADFSPDAQRLIPLLS